MSAEIQDIVEGQQIGPITVKKVKKEEWGGAISGKPFIDFWVTADAPEEVGNIKLWLSLAVFGKGDIQVEGYSVDMVQHLDINSREVQIKYTRDRD